MPSQQVKKVVLAYSGGLDTSVIFENGCKKNIAAKSLPLPLILDRGKILNQPKKSKAAWYHRYLYRRFARGICKRLCLSHVSRQCPI